MCSFFHVYIFLYIYYEYVTCEFDQWSDETPGTQLCKLRDTVRESRTVIHHFVCTFSDVELFAAHHNLPSTKRSINRRATLGNGTLRVLTRNKRKNHRNPQKPTKNPPKSRNPMQNHEIPRKNPRKSSNDAKTTKTHEKPTENREESTKTRQINTTKTHKPRLNTTKSPRKIH